MRRTTMLALGLLAGFALASGTAAAPGARIALVGARPAEAAALHTLVSRLHLHALIRVELTRKLAPGLLLTPGKLVLVSASDHSTLGRFEGELLGGLYSHETRRLHLRTVRIVNADGSLTTVEGGPPFSPGNGHVESLPSVVVGAGATVVELRRLGDAVALTIKTPVPGHLISARLARLRKALRTVSGNAWYLGIERSDGTTAYAEFAVPGDSVIDRG